MDYHGFIFNRSDEHDRSTTLTMKLESFLNNVPYSTTYVDTLSGVDTTWHRGVALSQFYKRKKRGELLPMTPYEKFSRKGSISGAYDFHVIAGANHWHTKVSPKYVPTVQNSWVADETYVRSKFPSLDDQYYLQAAAAKIYAGFDALTFLAELSSVKALFRTTTRRVLDYLRNPLELRGSPFKVTPTPKRGRATSERYTIPEDWLTYRYGVRPLINDIKNLNEALQQLTYVKERIEGRAGVMTSSFQRTAQTIDTGYGYSVTSVLEETISVGVRGCITADITMLNVLFDPLRTAWEKIPYSFVIDWLLGVGKALDAMQFLNIQNNYAASTGTSIKVTRVYNYDAVQSPTAYGTLSISGLSESVYNYRYPAHVSIIPRVNVRVDGSKIADLLALLTTSRRSKTWRV